MSSRFGERRILGLDPGLARLGWGVVSQRGNRLRALEYGTFTTPAGRPAAERLASLFRELVALVKRAAPDAAALEELFFSRNVKTALLVGQARGVCLLVLGRAKVPVHEYKPNTVKQAVTGYGSADKHQVQRMVKVLLNLPGLAGPDDTADALAVAITHCHAKPNEGVPKA